MTGFKQIFLNEMVEELGEDATKGILSDFSCPINADVERFLKSNSIEFSKRGIAQTTLVFASFREKPVLVGYYALANKTIVVPKQNLSSKWRSRINRFGKYSEWNNGYEVAAPLIAQLGKNFTYFQQRLISGDELLELACLRVKQAQLAIGGRFTYLECEDTPKLIDFYSDNGFVNFGKRPLDTDEREDYEATHLVQMLKYL